MLLAPRFELRGITALFNFIVTARRMNRFIWLGTKARGTRNSPIGANLSWLLPPSQSERSPGRRADLHVAAGNVVGGHEAGNVLERSIRLPRLAIANATSTTHVV